MNTRVSIYIIIGLFYLLASCTNAPHEENHAHPATEMNPQMEEDDHDEIYLTKAQMETMNITFGAFSDIKINDFIQATGALDLPPQSRFSVSTKVPGFIKNSRKYVEGNYVKRGEIIAYIESMELLNYQEKYLEARVKLEFLNAEESRQIELKESNAAVEKDVQRTQRDRRVQEIEVESLARKLQYCGIPVKDLDQNSISDKLAIRAPISGYISRINIHDGLFVKPETELMEVVSEDHLHLELDVFERDLSKLKVGQRISYVAPALGNKQFEGEVQIIGKEFNKENKTVRIHGHLEGERPIFIKDLFIEAKIWLTDQTNRALPERAIIQDGLSAYIFAGEDKGDKVVFEKIRVVVGSSDKGYSAIELIDSIPKDMRVITDGAYYIFAQSMAEELEHDH
jgi:cobalt-zinc-cadmium efflux system membrane fusion protein